LGTKPDAKRGTHGEARSPLWENGSGCATGLGRLQSPRKDGHLGAWGARGGKTRWNTALSQMCCESGGKKGWRTGEGRPALLPDSAHCDREKIANSQCQTNKEKKNQAHLLLKHFLLRCNIEGKILKRRGKKKHKQKAVGGMIKLYRRRGTMIRRYNHKNKERGTSQKKCGQGRRKNEANQN